MTLIKQKSGIFQVRFMVDGKTFQKSSHSKNKAKAQQIERQYRQEILDKKLLGVKDSINLYDALDLFLTSKIDLKSYDDIANKVRGVKLYFDDKPLNELTTADVEHYVLTRRQEGRAAQTIEHGIIQLRGCIEYMDRLDHQVPVIKFPKIKVQNQRIRSLSRDEEIRLLAELVPDNTKYYKKLTPFTDKPELMKYFLTAIKEAALTNEANEVQEAVLRDCILHHQRKPQLCGFFFDWDQNGEITLNVGDAILANKKRMALGLATIEEDMVKHKNEVAKEPGVKPEDIKDRQKQEDEWARRVGWRSS